MNVIFVITFWSKKNFIYRFFLCNFGRLKKWQNSIMSNVQCHLSQLYLHHQVWVGSGASYPQECQRVCPWCLRSCTRSTPSQDGSSIYHLSPETQKLKIIEILKCTYLYFITSLSEFYDWGKKAVFIQD